MGKNQKRDIINQKQREKDAMADFVEDYPSEKKPDIYERCGKHAQTMMKFNDVLIQVSNMNNRQDNMEDRLVKLEKMKDDIFDRIETKLDVLLKRG
jgi:hypothetical protein